jgi:energy-coupling factor transport system ATP-binding protein
VAPLRDALPAAPGPHRVGTSGAVLLEAADVTVTHDGIDAVRWVDTALHAGSVSALMGRNGAGKSSLLWALQGTGARSAGTVLVRGADGACDPASMGAVRRRALVGLVPQSASDLLYLETVGAECTQADTEAGAAPGTCRALLEDLAPGIPADQHPRDLSEGQRLALVVCVQLTAAPRVMLLDEPTRGLDYPAKATLGRFLRRLAEGGATVVVATHDVEFAAAVADRVVVMADGQVVADGPAAGVLCGSPAFAPQVAKVLAPAPWLTVDQVRAAAEVLHR